MITTKDAAAILGISTARLCLLLKQGRVKGAIKQGRVWMIPLHRGKPEISDKRKGPRGSWTRVKRPAKKVIHVNSHVIRSNNGSSKTEPVISVKISGKKDKLYSNYVEFVGLCRVVYRPDKPLNCGAKVWIETYADVFMQQSSSPPPGAVGWEKLLYKSQ